jgi:hypothetical protein
MPAFCARWPDGSFSIVDAGNKTDALVQLDEFGDEPAELWQMKSCLLDFEMTDHGTFRLAQLGELTEPEILARAYPLLSKTLEGEDFSEHAIVDEGESLNYGSEAAGVLREAVEAERERLRDFQRTEATTERGKDIQRQIGGSGVYIDAIVFYFQSGHGIRYKPGKNVKPS